MTSTTAPDPLGRIRDELVAAAARSHGRRVRRRRLLTFAALPALLLVGTGTAGALGAFSTGVPVIDQLLEHEVSPQVDFRPGPGGASEPLPLPNSGDGEGATAVAYLNRDGNVCQAQGDFRKHDGAARGSYGGGCYPPAQIARTLDRKKAIFTASSHGADMRIYRGFADGDVVAIHLRTEDGSTFEAQLTPPWTPDAPGGEPLRLFAAVDDRQIDVGDDGLQPEELGLLDTPFTAEAELSDGSVVPIRTPFGG